MKPEQSGVIREDVLRSILLWTFRICRLLSKERPLQPREALDFLFHDFHAGSLQGFLPNLFFTGCLKRPPPVLDPHVLASLRTCSPRQMSDTTFPAMEKPVKSCAPRKIACADRASP